MVAPADAQGAGERRRSPRGRSHQGDPRARGLQVGGGDAVGERREVSVRGRTDANRQPARAVSQGGRMRGRPRSRSTRTAPRPTRSAPCSSSCWATARRNRSAASTRATKGGGSEHEQSSARARGAGDANHPSTSVSRLDEQRYNVRLELERNTELAMNRRCLELGGSRSRKG